MCTHVTLNRQRRINMLDLTDDIDAMVHLAIKNAESGLPTQELQDKVIASKDAYAILRFACDVNGADIPTLQAAMDEYGTRGDRIDFAHYVKDADIAGIQQDVVHSGKPQLIIRFGREVESADKKLLENALAECGTPQDMLTFAKNVDGADISYIQQLIVESADTKLIYDFARYVKGADVDVLQDAMLKYETDPSSLRDFAMDVLGANAKLLNSKAADMDSDGSPAYYKRITDSLPHDELVALYEKIIRLDCTKDDPDDPMLTPAKRGYYAYDFAKNADWADKKEMEAKVFGQYAAFLFARDIPDADVPALQKKMVSAEFLLAFAQEVPGADLPAIRKELKSLNTFGSDSGCLAKFDRDVNIKAALGDAELGKIKAVNAADFLKRYHTDHYARLDAMFKKPEEKDKQEAQRVRPK